MEGEDLIHHVSGTSWKVGYKNTSIAPAGAITYSLKKQYFLSEVITAILMFSLTVPLNLLSEGNSTPDTGYSFFGHL